jgi:hypothetical protein
LLAAAPLTRSYQRPYALNAHAYLIPTEVETQTQMKTMRPFSKSLQSLGLTEITCAENQRNQ